MFKLTLLLATVTLGFAQEAAMEDENITNLDLSNRNLENLDDFNFSKLKKLESIDLSYNDLVFIGDDTFRNNPKLKTINLAGNPRLKVPEFSSFFIANVENLNLSHCDVEAVYENSFDGLLDVKSIDLSYNPIRKNGISYHALKTLTELREITVSQSDGPLFEEICRNIDLTIFVKSESNNVDIKCADVRAGKLEAILPVPEKKNEAKVKHEVAVPLVVEETEAPPVAEEHVTEQNAKEEDGELNTTQDNQEVEANTIVPDVVPPPQIDSVKEKETEPKKDNTETGEPNPLPPIPIEEKPKTESETQKIEVPNSKTDVEARKNEVPNPKTDVEAPKNEVPYPKTDVEAPKNEVAKNNNEISKTEDGSSKDAKTMLGQEIDKDGEAKVQQSESSSQPAAGTTVLVILVIVAVVGGLAAFGYKYYKSGQEDEKEPMEKELQEITIDSKPNGATAAVENEPLIHQRKYSVEIKEVDEATEDQNKNKSSQNGSSYIPITTVEKVIDEESDSNQGSK